MSISTPSRPNGAPRASAGLPEGLLGPFRTSFAARVGSRPMVVAVDLDVTTSWRWRGNSGRVANAAEHDLRSSQKLWWARTLRIALRR